MLNFKIFLLLMAILACSTTPFVWAGSIENKGDRPVKLTGRSSNGILGALTLDAKQKLPVRQDWTWIKHVPEGPVTDTEIEINYDDGTVGSILTFGGEYHRPISAPQKKSDTPAPRPAQQASQEGYAINQSNVQVYITYVRKYLNSEKTVLALPGQTITFPKDTIEVRTQPLNAASDIKILISVLMPDGTRESIQSPRGIVRLRD